MIGSKKLSARLDALEARLERIEDLLRAVAREPELRDELTRTRAELDRLAQQSLHVVDLLGESRQRIRDLEEGRR